MLEMRCDATQLTMRCGPAVAMRRDPAGAMRRDPADSVRCDAMQLRRQLRDAMRSLEHGKRFKRTFYSNNRFIQTYVYHVQVSSVRVSSVSLNSARRGAGAGLGWAFGLLFHNPPNQKLSKVRISKLDISPKNDKTRA